MSRKRKNKMNEQQTQTTTEVTQEPVREIIGTNPDGSPIYREEFTQTQAHTGESAPAQ